MGSIPDDAATHIMRPPVVEVDGLELTVIDGPDRGTRQAVQYGVTRIGTAAGSHLRLTDATVSRIHCEIRLRSGDVRIVDSDSTNGTFIDGHRVYEAALVPGTTVRVGSTTLRVERALEPLQVQVSQRDRFGDIIGESVEMRRIYTILERVAPTDATVLIQGETGTGKEIAARAIHAASSRASMPFVAVDCGAIAEHLIESELFGHVRGAFTGAVGDRKGLFEAANGGTLFLDEVGELPASLQPKLLRAIEMREVRPVGSNASRSVDTRLIAATNRRLDRSVNEGTFREDLYYRLAVIEIYLPPLRARREDIPRLAAHFYAELADGERIPLDLMPALLGRSWPGNVRELRNYIERSISLGWESAPAGTGPDILPPGAEALVPVDLPLKEARAAWEERFEQVYVRALLRKTGGNVSRAASLASVTRRTIQRMMVAAGLRSQRTPDGEP
jgi:transcriptional regulator with PAS, ATPase and Fis domain